MGLELIGTHERKAVNSRNEVKHIVSVYEYNKFGNICLLNVWRGAGNSGTDVEYTEEQVLTYP